MISKNQIKMDYENKNWRIRNSSYQSLIQICVSLKNAQFYEKYASSIILQGLLDKADSVRKEIAKHIHQFQDILSD